MSLLFKSLKSFVLLALLSGCGYHFVSHQEGTVTVPFIIGDKNGDLTAALIEELDKSPTFSFVQEDGTYQLVVKMVNSNDRQIGFRYRTNDLTGAILDKMSPTESRKSLKVSAELVHSITGETVVGPVIVESDFDYDYADSQSYRDLAFTDAQGNTQTVLNASLGQLDAEEDASSIAKVQLHKRVAKKVVRALQFISN